MTRTFRTFQRILHVLRMHCVSLHMRQFIVALAMSIAAASSVTVQAGEVATWATATSKHATNGRVIIFRYAEEFRAAFEKSSLPGRVILVWRYDSPSGMPAVAEREAMDWLEDLLEPLVERSGLAVLLLVSTGENLREWTYSARSEQEFFQALNKALAKQPRFPIEIHAAPDPKWATYEHFRQGVRE